MMSRYLSIFSVLVLLSACATDGTEDANLEGTNMGEDGIITIPDNDDGGITTGDLGPIEPGSQEDLIANVGDRVFFSFNSATLSAQAQNTLKKQAEWMQGNPGVTILVEGHCDERGTREYNLALGDRRANSVKKYLVRLGIDSGRISTISYGKEHPEFLGSNEAAWSKNRRGVSVVLQ